MENFKLSIWNIVVGVVITFIATSINKCGNEKVIPHVEDFCEQVLFVNTIRDTVKIEYVDTVYLEKIKMQIKYITKVKRDTFYEHIVDTVFNNLVPIYANVFTTHHEGRDANLKLLTWNEIIVSNDTVLNNRQVAEYEIKYNNINTVVTPKPWSLSVGVTVPLTNTDTYIPMPTAALGYKNHSLGFSFDIHTSQMFGTYLYTFSGTKTEVNRLKTKINGKLQ